MLIFAHRGASGQAPENTLAAMDLALTQGADAIELDLQRVEDTLVVLHDRWLHKTTNGQGRLQDASLAALAQLDAGNGEPVPTLWQVLERVAGRCDLNLELKGHDTLAPLLAILARAERELGYRPAQFLISSFHHPLLAQLKAERPDLAIGALTASLPQDYAAFGSALGAHSVNVDVDFVDAALVADAHRRGLKVYVYTVDQPEDMKAMRALGVDGIFTNHPDRARSVLGGETRPPGGCGFRSGGAARPTDR
ncbi:glycerophosphodiester phosphodiesterase [Ferrimonas balearica]|uniref:glycerophosphodiester phosphodiesterase n=1 Tax=Ferrimonas balearica TaxID=44012 RepID=UPI001C996CF0|nr:glycerophosphodiester phosphodiesterase family protein [Ferrimonas balearica]MBY5992284.1 glycerophosphodiester phosphodiesterase [Ferrimonas balearica]